MSRSLVDMKNCMSSAYGRVLTINVRHADSECNEHYISYGR